MLRLLLFLMYGGVNSANFIVTMTSFWGVVYCLNRLSHRKLYIQIYLFQKAKSLELESKPEWRDIDADTKDPMFAPEYAADIFENLRKRELDFLVEDYLSNQAEITETMRAILIDWLVEV